MHLLQTTAAVLLGFFVAPVVVAKEECDVNADGVKGGAGAALLQAVQGEKNTKGKKQPAATRLPPVVAHSANAAAANGAPTSAAIAGASRYSAALATPAAATSMASSKPVSSSTQLGSSSSMSGSTLGSGSSMSGGAMASPSGSVGGGGGNLGSATGGGSALAMSALSGGSQARSAVNTGVSSGAGATATLNAEGYKQIVKLQSDVEMGAFITHLVDSMGGRIIDLDKFHGVVPFYSGTRAGQSFENLQNEIWTSATSPKDAWVQLSGATAPLTEQGYQAVALQKDNMEMDKFVRRALMQMGKFVADEAGLQGVIPYYSGEKAVQSYSALEDEIKSAVTKGLWARR